MAMNNDPLQEAAGTDAFHDAARLLRDELERSINNEIAAAALDQSGGANNAYHSSVLAKSEGVQNIRKDKEKKREEARRAELMAQLMMQREALALRITELEEDIEALNETIVQLEQEIDTILDGVFLDDPEARDEFDALSPDEQMARMQEMLDNGEISFEDYNAWLQATQELENARQERDQKQRELDEAQREYEAVYMELDEQLNTAEEAGIDISSYEAMIDVYGEESFNELTEANAAEAEESADLAAADAALFELQGLEHYSDDPAYLEVLDAAIAEMSPLARDNEMNNADLDQRIKARIEVAQLEADLNRFETFKGTPQYLPMVNLSLSVASEDAIEIFYDRNPEIRELITATTDSAVNNDETSLDNTTTETITPSLS